MSTCELFPVHLGDLPTFPSASVSDTGYRTVNSSSDENAITCDHYEMEEQSGGRGNAIFRAETEQTTQEGMRNIARIICLTLVRSASPLLASFFLPKLFGAVSIHSLVVIA